MSTTQKTPQRVEYFVTSPKRLLLLSIFTAGVYQVYWFYKNWSAVKDATGADIQPFWRAIFSVFWAHALFKQIAESAGKGEAKNKYSPNMLATVYVVAAIASNAIGYIEDYGYITFVVGFGLLVVSTLPLFAMQKVVNAQNGKRAGDVHKGYGKTKKEMALVLAGNLIFVIWVGSVFLFPASPALTPEQQSLLDKSNELTAQYDDCSSALKLKEGSLNTNDSIATAAYQSDADKCESIRVQQNEASAKYNAAVGL